MGQASPDDFIFQKNLLHHREHSMGLNSVFLAAEVAAALSPRRKPWDFETNRNSEPRQG